LKIHRGVKSGIYHNMIFMPERVGGCEAGHYAVRVRSRLGLVMVTARS